MSVETPDAAKAALKSTGPLLRGKVILVLGASRGIGAGIAKGLARAEATLVLASRNLGATEAVAAEITEFAPRPMVLNVDVSDAQSVRDCVNATVKKYKRLDGAVNNAGISHPAHPFAEIPDDNYDSVMDVNVRGMFYAMKAEITAMLGCGGGSIVNVASSGSFIAVPGKALYIASKHAVAGLTRVAAADYATRNIRVNGIGPGPTFTEMVARGLGSTEEGRTMLTQATPMKRFATSEEMAGACIWLLSDLASYVTGTVVPIDGGWTAV